jgi:hypothetical protein
MKRPTISRIQRKSRRSDRGLPPPEVQELLDHLAKEIASEYLRLLTPEPGRLADRDRDEAEVNK